jgi:hypothetical protein
MNHYQLMPTDTPQQASYAQQETHQSTYMPQIPALPQETNYAMETAHAATSRAPFSEAEESMDSDGNDDRLSGQAVSARGKKRTPQNHKYANNEKQ